MQRGQVERTQKLNKQDLLEFKSFRIEYRNLRENRMKILEDGIESMSGPRTANAGYSSLSTGLGPHKPAGLRATLDPAALQSILSRERRGQASKGKRGFLSLSPERLSEITHGDLKVTKIHPQGRN